MCRRNQLVGVALIALGVGILIGVRLADSFLVCCLAVAAAAFGFGLLSKKNLA